MAICAAVLSTTLAAQDRAGVDAAAALLRGDREQAVAHIAAVEPPARRARMQAALRPRAERAAAFLSVARVFRTSPEADLAILAGAAAVVQALDREEVVPELARFTELENDDDDDEMVAIAPVVEGLWTALRERTLLGGDRALLDQARRLLQIASVTRFDYEMARWSPQARLAVPSPRGEDMLLRAFRTTPGWLEFDSIDLGREPDRMELLPAGDTRDTIPGLPPGWWLVELASVQAPWRSVRAVEVSDLEVVALVERDRAALLVERDGAPTDAEIVLRADGHPAEPVELDGAGLLELPLDSPRSLEARDADGHVSWLDLPMPWRSDRTQSRWLAHLMTDRPLYRAGETIRARVVLREATWQGDGLDARVTVTTAADRELVARVTMPDDVERRVVARTDRHGLAEFAIDLPEDDIRGAVRFEISVTDGGLAAEVIDARPCRIATFERPTITVHADGPASVRATATDLVTVTARAAWASGGPAAGIRARAEVRYWRRDWYRYSRAERRELRSDADGRVALAVHTADLDPGRVRVEFTFESPDGRDESATHEFRVVEDPDPTDAARSDDLILQLGEVPVVDHECSVQVRGPAGDHVLLVIGRGEGTRQQVVTLDEDGHGEATVVPGRAEWPFLDLCAATGDDSARLRAPFRLRVAQAPRIEIPTRTGPGGEVTCRVDVGVPDALVTVAVVDERLFTLAPDLTPDPAAALRPVADAPDRRIARSASATDARELFDEMLVDGRIPPHRDPSRAYGGAAGPGSGASPGLGQDAALREDFRATARFETVVTGADGTADLAFRMPDDLTTWRVTVVGVEPNGSAFAVRRALVTSKPLAAEPQLPRVLRCGDAIDVPIVIDRGVEAAGDGNVVELEVTGDGLEVEHGVQGVEVAAGHTAVTTARVRALRAGDHRLSLAAQTGPFADRSSRAVPVVRDAVTRALHTQRSGAGGIELEAHPDSSPHGQMEVTVSAGDATVRRILKSRLEDYPYGCVEQTLSGLLPFFAEVRGARAHGAPAPTMDRAFRERLASGLSRLRSLQDRPGGAFAWWPGDEVDLGMTALVLHGLCVMREGGLDPRTIGLGVEVDRLPLGGVLDEAGAELAAACLRWAPENADARAAAIALVDRSAVLPPGLAARLGLAFWQAGDAERARACLLHADRHETIADASAFPGEDPLAARALAVELAFRLDALRQAAVDELVHAVLARQGSTYANANALAALALVQPRRAECATLRVTVHAGDVERSIDLDEEHGFLASVQLPFSPRVRVVLAEDAHLHVGLRTEQVQRASDHPGWATPLHVERVLLRRDDDGELVEIGDQPPRVADRLAIRLRVTSPVRVRYAVVTCPLPAGLTLPFEPSWLQRFDDHVAFTATWLAPGWALERTFDVVATHAGRVVWPPATASSMYAEGCDGGSPGAWLEIGPARAAEPVADAAPCFAPRRPAAKPRVAPPEPEPTAVEALSDAIDEVWGEDDFEELEEPATAPDPGRVENLRGRIAALAAHGLSDRNALEELTWLRNRTSNGYEEARAQRHGQGWAQWHRGLRVEIDALQQGWTLELLRRIEDRAAGASLDDRLETAAEALAAWPERDARERGLATLLRAALRDAPSSLYQLLEDIEDPARTPELRHALLECTGIDDDSDRELAVALLPQADLAALPAAILVELMFGWLDEGVVTILADSADGRAELLRRCTDREFVSYNGDRLEEELPDELWDELPVEAYVLLAEEYDEDLALARLTAGGIPDATVQDALLRVEDPGARALLGEALFRRGAGGPGAALQDASLAAGPIAAAWDRVLTAAASGDAGTLERILADDPPPTLWLDEEALRGIALRALAGCGEPEALARWADEMPSVDWDEVFDRLGPDGQERLLRAATEELVELPGPDRATTRAALWDYGLRCDDLEDVIDTLCLTEVGAAFALAHSALLVDEEERWDAELWIEWATEDPEPEERWRMCDLLLEGANRAAEWTADERRALDAVLRLRGLW